jgi:hypothetical protein
MKHEYNKFFVNDSQRLTTNINTNQNLLNESIIILDLLKINN